MEKRLTVTVLGASSDLGQALVHAFVGEARKFNLTARRPADLEAFRADMLVREMGPEAIDLHFFDAQRIDFQSLRAMAAETDLLICCIGFLGDQQLAERDDDEAARILAANFTGPARAINVFAEAMAARPEGEARRGIIGVSSVAGERGRGSNYFYGASKAGFTAYLSGLRNRLFSKKIHVMTVVPGFMATKMTEGLPLPGLLTSTPASAARQIRRAWHRRSDTVFISSVWRLIMAIIGTLPESIFKRLSL